MSATTRPLTGAAPAPADGVAARARGGTSERGRWDRPLTSYLLLAGSTVLLVTLGLVMVLSASSVTSYRETRSSWSIAENQMLWVAIGVPIMLVAARLPVQAWRRLAWPLLVGTLGLLALVPVIGVEVYGNRNWLALGPLRVQPSELAKVALVIWGAHVLARKRPLAHEWGHLLVPVVPVAVLVVGLVLAGHDLGTALLLMVVVAVLMFLAGAPLRLFAVGGVAAAAVSALAVVANPTRLVRVRTWLDPASADPLLAGWQPAHGLYALAGGGWWGVGLGASRQKWGGLPEAHTDFIFAIIGEELGLAGTLTVLGLFVLFAYAGIRVALRSGDLFVRLAAGAATMWITAQALVNIGAVVGVLPIVGITLPLISYGGSSLVTTLLAVGMLLSFARAEPSAAAALRARGPLPARVGRAAAQAVARITAALPGPRRPDGH